MFKALTWIWFSKVNGPALRKNMCIKVDKARPGKVGSEPKKKLTIEAPPHKHQARRMQRCEIVWSLWGICCAMFKQ